MYKTENNMIEEKVIANCNLISNIKKRLISFEKSIELDTLNTEKTMNKGSFIKELKENKQFAESETQKIIEFINAVFKVCEDEDVVLFSNVEKDFYRTMETEEYNEMFLKYENLRKNNELINLKCAVVKKNLFDDFKMKTGKDLGELLHKDCDKIFNIIENEGNILNKDTIYLADILAKNVKGLKEIKQKFIKEKYGISQTFGVMKKKQERISDKKYIISINLTSCKDLTPIEIMAAMGHEKSHLQDFENGINAEYSDYTFLTGKEKSAAWWMNREEAEADKEGYAFVRRFLKENNIKYISLSPLAWSKLLMLKTENIKHVLSQANILKARLISKEIDKVKQNISEVRENEKIKEVVIENSVLKENESIDIEK